MRIDYSEDRLLSIADLKIEEGDSLCALRMLNRNVELGGTCADNFSLYAEAYEDLGLFEKSVNSWFKYIDADFTEEYTYAYEGLALNYMNIGQNAVSAFYYDKILKITDGISEIDRKQLLSTFLSDEKNPLKIVYPPQLADCAQLLSDGIEHLRNNRFDEAVDTFSQVGEGNADYFTARNHIATTHIIAGNIELAERECLDILSKDENNLNALITLAAVRSEQGNTKEGRALAKKLLAMNLTDVEDIYKVATVCCENKMHDEAYLTFCKLDDSMKYDFNVMYFKAVAAYLSGRVDESVEIMHTLLDIYPNAYTARYYLSEIKQAKKAGYTAELTYYYRLPYDRREEFIRYMMDFDSCKPSEITDIDYCWMIEECVCWCIDEADSRNDRDMLTIAASCAIKAKLDGIVRDMLLNAFYDDELKVAMLRMLVERNEENSFGAVCCHLYRCVDIYELHIGRNKKKIFMSAYADLICRFALMDESFSKMLADSAESLYEKLKASNKLGLCADKSALIVAIFLNSGIKLPDLKNPDLTNFFGADAEKVNALLED